MAFKPATDFLRRIAILSIAILAEFSSLSAQNAGVYITGSANAVISSSTTLYSAGDINIGSGSTLNNSGNIYLGGNWTNNGTFTSQNGNAVTFNGSGTQTITGSPTTFYDVNLSNASGGSTNFGTITTSISHNLTASSGTMNAGTSTIIFTGNPGTISGNSSKRFYKLQINPGAVITNPSGGNMHVFNSLTNNGTSFTQANTLTMFFDSSNSVESLSGLSASTTFGNVTIGSSSFGALPTTVNAGSLNFTITGTAFTFDSKNSVFNGGTSGIQTVTFNVAASGTCTIKNASGVTGTSANFYNVTTSTGLDFGSGISTINNNLTINTNGYVFNNAPRYGSSSTLIYNSSVASYGQGTEWSSTTGSTSSGIGIPENVTIQNTNVVAMASGNHSMAGSLLISSGGLQLNSGSGDLYIAGSWTRSSGIFTPNSRAVFFDGNTTQTLNTTGGEIFNYLLITRTSTLQLLSDATVNANGGLTLSSTAANTIDLNGHTMNLTGGGNLSLSSGTRTITSGVSGGIFSINGSNATVTSGGSLTFNNLVTVKLFTGFDFGANVSTIKGVLQINPNGFVNLDGPTYATGSLLQYYINGNYDRDVEWSKTSGVNYPYDVELSNSTYLNMNNHPITDLYYNIADNLIVDAGSTLDMNSTGNYLNVTRDVLINGTLKLSAAFGGDLDLGGNWNDNGTFNPNSRDVSFKGSSAQTITKSNSPFYETFDYLDINNSSGGVTLNFTPVTITIQLRLLSGIVFAGSNLVTVSSNASNAIVDYDSIPSVNTYYTSSWINGTLKRSAQVGGTYYFPIGTASYYELLRIAPIGGSGLTDMTTSFTNPSCNTISTQIATDLPYINNTQVNTGLDYGYWTVSPNGTYTSPKYNLTIYETGYNNCGSFQPAIKDSAYGIVKRTNSSSPWTGTFFGSNGYHHNSLQQQFNPSGALWCFKAVRDSIPSFSDYAIGYNGQDIALPLQLVAFDAHYENNLVHVNWTTASELNTDHFEIERSEDGLKFENIAKEEAAHHSISTLNYSYDDRNAPSLHVSPLYYRLRMVDEDSSASYSMTRSAQLPFSSSLNVQATPNPFSDHLLLNIVSSKVQQAQITISNEQGVVQLAIGDVSLQPGKNMLEFSSMGYLPSAVYFVRIATDASTVTTSIVKE